MKSGFSPTMRFTLFVAGIFSVVTLLAAAQPPLSPAMFDKTIRPLLKEYCLKCHSTKEQKGDLDLERFTSFDAVKKVPKVWQLVDEQIGLGEMPPKDKPQLSAAQKTQLVAWVRGTLAEIARASAGDPGPVILRRLSNAEFTYTVRDLTGISSLDPVREFPVDGAAGEGFSNTGAALVMSPALLAKYLDAAKDIAAHAVLLPDGIGFSPSTSSRDWAEERLTSIRAFYAGYAEPGGGSAVNLQGIKFDTKDGGVLPLVKYLAATLTERDALIAKRKSIADVAREYSLNAKYLGALWATLNDKQPSLVLDAVRAQWRTAKPADAPALTATIAQWQRTLWRFTTIGHIGKRDGPKAWLVPVVPLAASQEVRLKMPAAADGKDVTLYLLASDAGDGNAQDFAVWENPRLVAPGRPDLRLRDIRDAVQSLTSQRERVAASVILCLDAAAETGALPDKAAVTELAKKHGVDPALLVAWLDYLGIGGGPVRVDSHIKQKSASAQGYEFIKGWTGADALSVIANSSAQHVRVPGNVKPHSIAVHPTPKLRVAIGWSSPVTGKLRVEGTVQHAHPECGNGVTWSLELRRGNTRQRLATGLSQGAKEIKFGPIENVAVEPGDLLSLIIGPRDGNHSCDLTAVDITLGDGKRVWNLAKEVSPEILAGNPHADGFGNASVWHFYSEPDSGQIAPVIPADSLLAKWRAAASAEEKRRLAGEVQKLLRSGATGLAKDSPDAVLYRQLTSLNGPLLAIARDTLLALPREVAPAGGVHGVDPALFGKHPDGATLPTANLCVRAPSLIEVRLPADLVEGCEFVATARLHKETSAEGSVQMQVLLTKPANTSGLTASAPKEQGNKSTWSDGERPMLSDSPILVLDGSAARTRIEAALEAFRQLFPAALCYTKIVPVDEVVTLTLYHREDDHLRRLMLNDAQAAELDRLWSELRFVSQEPLKLVEAFEQLWQFATQDADPSAFTPMREPIKLRAAKFRADVTAAEPKQIQAVVDFADHTWRRPLTRAEKEELRALYSKLRTQELPHETALRVVLARIFVAPSFLYKLETPAAGKGQTPVTDTELATRLSFFLWSSAPDAELAALAAAGKLRNPDVLAAQTRRMIQDARVRRLANEFGAQWLHTRDFDKHNEKSERHFPTFAAMRAALNEEPVRFFTDFFQRDGSVLDLLNADHTFVNGALAQHYGIAGVSGEVWRRVEGVQAKGRGGVLGFGATLAMQSGASRTSPILRGNWISETLLGERLPRPPKGVPVLPEVPPAGLTERALTEKHSSDPKCAGCHLRIDPLGFALEGFDAIGRLRTKDAAGLSIDARTRTVDGTELDGLNGLRSYILNQRRDAFTRQFCRKLLGYSLGRGVQLSDQPLIEAMQAKLAANNYRVGVVMEMIVRSRQFCEIRNRDSAVSE